MKSYLFLIFVSIQNLYSNSIYYQTLWQIMYHNKSTSINLMTEKNIEIISNQLKYIPDILFTSFSLNIIEKERIRIYLLKHEYLLRETLQKLKNTEQLQEITWAFLALYYQDKIRENNYSKLLNRAQEMYNILYHLYSYQKKFQGTYP